MSNKIKSKDEYSIQTVTNAVRVLLEFQGEEELGVAELSRRLGLHKNNVFRQLATLELSGFIEQSPTERYRLGLASLELGQSFARSRDLMRRARPVLEELSTRHGESAHLGTLQDFEIVHLDAEVPSQLLAASSRVGLRLPVHCTALGKVLLGCSPASTREAYDRDRVAGRPLPHETDATIVDPHKFFEHLRTVAGQGFAVDLEECARGLRCAAAPVFDESGAPVAAVSVSGPSVRMSEERVFSEVVPSVTAAAERLSRELGFASS